MYQQDSYTGLGMSFLRGNNSLWRMQRLDLPCHWRGMHTLHHKSSNWIMKSLHSKGCKFLPGKQLHCCLPYNNDRWYSSSTAMQNIDLLHHCMCRAGKEKQYNQLFPLDKNSELDIQFHSQSQHVDSKFRFHKARKLKWKTGLYANFYSLPDKALIQMSRQDNIHQKNKLFLLLPPS